MSNNESNNLLATGENIIATHTTPVLRFVDDIKFVFHPAESDGCIIVGHSVSRSWYAILDSGTNYRNMYNLMTVTLDTEKNKHLLNLLMSEGVVR
ncbi:hypothetical protein JZ751_028181 [Albula glossodonta]|uniref:Uncharacterized protein n=1 Tax=Albula glossodonta TaxID=121402 RepID=A0A8T2P8E4_9TELE|nr:hypothetical protein JZ751_028181 [Albula glossodonta]